MARALTRRFGTLFYLSPVLSFSTTKRLGRWLATERLEKFNNPLYWTSVNINPSRLYCWPGVGDEADKSSFGVQLEVWSAPGKNTSVGRILRLIGVLPVFI